MKDRAGNFKGAITDDAELKNNKTQPGLQIKIVSISRSGLVTFETNQPLANLTYTDLSVNSTIPGIKLDDLKISSVSLVKQWPLGF